MSKRYWSLIESPFQKFAAWVDEEGRLLRFNLRASGAAKPSSTPTVSSG